MSTAGFNLLLTVSGPRRAIDYLAFAVDTFTDEQDIFNVSWAAAAVEVVQSDGLETRLAEEVDADAESTYAVVCSRPEITGKRGKASWHLKSQSNCAQELAVITKWFPELDVVVVEQQVAPVAGPLLYLTYYTGERHIEYRMSKSEASRRAMPGPRTPPPCPRVIKTRAVRAPGAVRSSTG